MLRLEGVVRSFGGKRAVDQVSFVVPAGQLLGVIGRSGAGKSTLLRMINRLADPTTGRILCGDIDVTALARPRAAAWRARCAMVFQQFNLAGRLDVLTNVLMGRAFHGRRRGRCSSCGRRGQGDRASRRWSARHGARRPARRHAVGRPAAARRHRPRAGAGTEIILADEPIASLDPRNTQLVMDALRASTADSASP